MAFVPLYGFQTSLTAPTAANAGLLEIDPAVAAELATQLGAGTSYASLSDGVNYELVKITAVNSPNLVVVQRAQDGTSSYAFPLGACLRFEWVAQGIAAISSGTPPTIVGTGAATAVYDPVLNQYTVNVPATNITATLPAQVLGSFPDYEIAFQATNGGCCCGSGGGGGSDTPITITGTGLVSVTGTDPTFNVQVLAPNFIGTSGVTVTGTWPNITITGPGVIPPSGVESVSGSTKILISGSLANPVVNLQTNGSLGAGTYNGVTFDAYGTITAVDSGYVPITTITSDNANLVVTPTGPGAVLLHVPTQTVPAATTSTQGIVQLAPATAIGSNNPGDSTSAVTPAGVNAVLTAVLPPAVAISSNGFFTAASPGTYTTTVAGASLTLTASNTQTVTIRATAMVADTALAPAVWGLGVFNGATLLQGVAAFATGCQSIEFQIPGPLVAANISLKTTALAGTASVVGASLTAIIK